MTVRLFYSFFHFQTLVKMRASLPLILLIGAASADKPAVAPAYVAPAYVAPRQDNYGSPAAPAAAAPDTYGSPAAAPDTYGSPAAPPQEDSYGSPASPPISTPDSYGSPAAPVQDTYGSPAADPVSAGPGTQGYYYYYYPVKQATAASTQSEDDGGLLGGLFSGGLAGLLTTKVLLLILGIAGFVLITSLGINLGGRRSLARSISPYIPYHTIPNLIQMLEFVNSAIVKYD